MANNPNAAANLKPFVKGDPRRINRPKGIPNSKTRLRRLLELTQNLENPITGTVEGFTVMEQMDMKMILKAKDGDLNAYKEIVDRLEGKANQAVDVTTNGESIAFVNQVPRAK